MFAIPNTPVLVVLFAFPNSFSWLFPLTFCCCHNLDTFYVIHLKLSFTVADLEILFLIT